MSTGETAVKRLIECTGDGYDSRAILGIYDVETMKPEDLARQRARHNREFVSAEDYTALERRVQELRAALVGLIGVDGREELEAMEAFMRLTPAPAADKAAAVDAIHVLLATLPAPLTREGRSEHREAGC